MGGPSLRTNASLSRRARAVAPFLAMGLLARARELEAQGRDVIHLEVGEPDFPMPEAVRRAAAQSVAAGRVGYTPACGLPELRQAIARFYAEREGVTLDWHRVVVTPGASGALTLALAATLDVGQGVLLGDPGYPSNRHLATLLGLDPQALPLSPEDGFQPRPEQVAQQWREHTGALLLTTPANPTGAVVEGERMAALAAVVRARGGHLLVDEIYRGLIYGPPVPSVLRIEPEAWVINSFSKFFGLTGWRLGWLVVPEWALETVDRLAQNLFLSPSAPAQAAALAALSAPVLAELDRRRERLAARRDFLLEALTELGFRVPVPPRGAFYLYTDCSPFGEALPLAERFLEAGGVAVTPGVDFGACHTRHFLRFAFTADRARLAEAVRRIAALLPQARSSTS